ncbi:MAG: patatin-like phospholipase family protein [Planctomycetes bacterium]|nr:patatin-like phospholipase family protein [Planctomycetota bacterium]
MSSPNLQQRAKRASLLASVLLLGACGTVQDRTPPPAELAGALAIPGIPDARRWGDAGSPQVEAWLQREDSEVRARFSDICDREHSYLALSGGGANGAYGAGLLCGWSTTGKRPKFTLVTGVSTGALAAPFAFLGPDYDDELKEVYTTTRTRDILEERTTLAALTGDSFYDTAKLASMIERYITTELLEAVAVEHRKGRGLYIATTNLDAMRPVIWNLGAIAASEAPEKLALARRVLLASASIPLAFPPVLFDVDASDGKRYDELHVDGGATAQVFLYPLGVDWGAVEKKLGVRGRPDVYVIYNNKLEASWSAIDPPCLTALIEPTMSSLIRTQGIGDLYRMYVGAQRDGLKFHLAHIPSDFQESQKELFDKAYMTKLFERGFAQAQSGKPWLAEPPGM